MGRQGNIEFWIDVLTEERISGWAWKPEEPGIGLTIELLVDSKPEAAFAAQEWRSDLHAAGKSAYGFEVLIPPLVRDGREHELGLRVKGEAGPFFRLKPRSFLCPVSDGLDPAAMGRQGNIEFWIDVLTEERISGWACKPEEPGIGLTIELLVDGKPEAAFAAQEWRSDLQAAGKNGYGFEVLIPTLVRDGREHELGLRVKGEAGPFFRLKPRRFLRWALGSRGCCNNGLKSDSSCAFSAAEELVLGLASASARTHLIIIGDAIDPTPFKKTFQQVICVPSDSAHGINGHEIHNFANESTIVLCLISYEGPSIGISRTIVECYDRNAIVVRISAPSEELQTSFRRGNFLQAFEQQVDVKPIFLGLLMPVNASVPSRAVAVYDREVQSAIRQVLDEDASKIEQRPPLAIMSCYNEEDIIEEVVLDYRRQGCELLILDNWSTDTTWKSLERLHELDPDCIKVCRFPDRAPRKGSWRAILARKEEVALQQPGRWILHVDADELRRSPFEGLTLAQALRVAQISGANRIDFNVLNFRPVHGGEWSGSLESAFRFFEFPDHWTYFYQKKAWIQPRERVNLRDTGGHEASFDDKHDFRYKFLLKHFPIRSVPQGRNKLHRYRQARWDEYEKETMGWHVHNESIGSTYSSLIWPIEELHEFNQNSFYEEYGLVVASTLAFFLSPVANGRLVNPQYWSDPRQTAQLANLAIETRMLRAETWSAKDSLQAEQNSLTELRAETRSLKGSLQAEFRAETRSLKGSLQAELRAETWSLKDSLQAEQNSLSELRAETRSLMNNLKKQTAAELERVQKLADAERERLNNVYRQQVAHAGRRSGIWARLLGRFRYERTILSESGLVDAEWYLRNYPEVVETPVDHYVRVGASEGRDPNPMFSTKAYLKLNPDVAISGMNPLLHFVLYGAAEGRRFSE